MATWPIILLAVAGAADAAGIFVWYACAYPKSRILGPAIIRGPSHRPRVALTFDDGPQPPYTEQILEILADNRTPATFFVCGRNAELYPGLVRSASVAGHSIGNHAYSHPYMYGLSVKRIADEIRRTQDAVVRAAGVRPRFFRPPYGSRWFGLYPVLKQNNLTLVQWSDTGRDWELPADEIAKAVLSGLRPGAVIVLHDGVQASGGFLKWKFGRKGGAQQEPPGEIPASARAATIAALPAILRGVRAMGYDFVALEEFVP